MSCRGWGKKSYFDQMSSHSSLFVEDGIKSVFFSDEKYDANPPVNLISAIIRTFLQRKNEETFMVSLPKKALPFVKDVEKEEKSHNRFLLVERCSRKSNFVSSN